VLSCLVDYILFEIVLEIKSIDILGLLSTPLFGARCRGVIWAIWRMKSGTDAIKTLKKTLFLYIFFKVTVTQTVLIVFISI
jgi:hypothetical protein